MFVSYMYINIYLHVCMYGYIYPHIHMYKLSSVQSLSHVQLFATPWTTACQASLTSTNSQSLLKLMSIKLVMTFNHLILCCPLLFLPSIFPNIRVFIYIYTLYIFFVFLFPLILFIHSVIKAAVKEVSLYILTFKLQDI